MINVKNNFTMIIGGQTEQTEQDGKVIAQTFYYNHTNKVWSNGPTLNKKRMSHAVGIVTDEVSQEKLVVVTGGYINGNVSKSTEVLFDSTWSIGEIMWSCITPFYIK